MVIIPLETNCLTYSFLSQCQGIDDIGCDYNLISSNKFFNHSASLPVATKAINLDSITEWVI